MVQVAVECAIKSSHPGRGKSGVRGDRLPSMTEYADASLNISVDNDPFFAARPDSGRRRDDGDDTLETEWGESEYTGGSGADQFLCSEYEGDVVTDYNPDEEDVVSSNCEEF